jgi:hypothetical protein
MELTGPDQRHVFDRRDGRCPMSLSGRAVPSNPAASSEKRGGVRWTDKARKLRVLLGTLATKRPAWRRGLRGTRPISSPETPLSLSPNFFDKRTHLQKYCEHALDAHTIEDAIFWHSEIINELSVEIHSVGAKPWSEPMKAQTVADLSELQSRHGAILHRLTGIVARNEQFIWQPQSLCKK